MDRIEVDEGYVAFLAQRRAELLGRIDAAAREAGRDPAEVVLAAVSKTVDVDAVAAARRAGYAHFAENRPQELRRKLDALAAAGELDGTTWHMIGNLQTNKINAVLGCAPALVHSVGSLELARAIAKRAEAAGVVQRALIEVNVSGEASKSGVAPDELRAQLGEWLAVGESLPFDGLMTMAPADDPRAARDAFAGLRALRDELAPHFEGGLEQLSMGMSGDFEEAVRQGATIVRLGRIVFDPTFGLD